MDVLVYIWYAVQIIIGINLVFPLFLYLSSCFKKQIFYFEEEKQAPVREFDYAIIVTAYQQTTNLYNVVNSISKLQYRNYLIYIVADDCDISNLNIENEQVVLLRPELPLSSNTKSHKYALDRLHREHDLVTIIDSDNLVDPQYLNKLNRYFAIGFRAVQGVRKAKNSDTDLAALDAARDMYYHFYDGKLLFQLGSSATLAGSGMAFDLSLYKNFLESYDIQGAGFDKVLQAWIVTKGLRIAFAEDAVVFDEKTSQKDQLITQRSRWIGTWFKYFKLGFQICKLGIARVNLNQLLFGLVLLRPPLFIFLLLSGLFLSVNVFYSTTGTIVWCLAFVLFIVSFYISLVKTQAKAHIYQSLIKIPQFVFFQILSLLHLKKPKSISTTHFYNQSLDDVSPDENKS